MRDSELFKLDVKNSGFQSVDWHLIGGFSPHKTFLWDQEGTYLDYAAPNPIHGHFLGGVKLRGRNIKDLFLKNKSELLMQAIHQSLEGRLPTVLGLDIDNTHGSYQSLVRMFPMHHFVVGWVNDFPIQGNSCDWPQVHHQRIGPNPLRLTSREWEVSLLVANHKSNEDIAQLLKITPRTVKFHLSHVMEKLQLSSRFQVKIVVPHLH